MMRDLILRLARAFKGDGYTLDPALPLSAVFGVAWRRLFALLRGGVALRLRAVNPRAWPFLGPRVVLRNRGLIRFGVGVSLGAGVLVDGLSRKGVSFGDRVNIGPSSIIEATGVLSNLGEGFSMGCDSGMGAFSFVGAAGGVWIGSNVIMGQRVSFHSENHRFESMDRPIREQGVTRQGITIEDDCWVGANVVFLDGAYVERGCVIAAGAVVRGRIPAFSIIGGVPARVIRSRLS